MDSQALARVLSRARAALGDEAVSRLPRDRLLYGSDRSYFAPLAPDAVVFPRTTEEAAQVVALCFEHTVPVIAYGIGSSLEGHVGARSGGLTLDMHRHMNQVVELHAEDMAVTVQAGIQRLALNEWLKPHGLFFPVDPGADATVGGMVGTGASGTTAVGYGTMRDNVVRMKVVSADGSVLLTGSRVRKSSAGYDLTHLMIGSEGTLGVVTEVTLRVYRIPQVIVAGSVRFPDVERAARTVIQTIQQGVRPHRIELLNAEALRAVNQKFALNFPLQPTLFFEFHSPTAASADAAARESLFQQLALANDGVDFRSTADEAERDTLWKARHGAYWAASSLRSGVQLFVTDVCVPISRLADCVVGTERDFASSFLASPIVGHVGDGNFHLMIPVDTRNATEMDEVHRLNDLLVHRALEMDGTCTGEHGIGQGKQEFLEAELGGSVDVMRRIKRSLDPLNIFNPGKIFPID